MKRAEHVYLQHILDAVVRQLEIIGEATKRLPPHVRQRSLQTPWQDTAGMRDKLIHDYFNVDIHRVWLTATRDLPPLKAAIARILEEI